MVTVAVWLCLQGWPRRHWLEWQVIIERNRSSARSQITAVWQFLHSLHVQQRCIHGTGVSVKVPLFELGDQFPQSKWVYRGSQSLKNGFTDTLEPVP